MRRFGDFADGSGPILLVLRIVDKFGAPCLFGGDEVALTVEGPGVLIWDNPFDSAKSGGSGAVWIRAKREPPDAFTFTLATRSSEVNRCKSALWLDPEQPFGTTLGGI
jgi:beta-galactosidase